MPKKKNIKSKQPEKVSGIYCRKCMETKIPTHFYEATNKQLDTNGYFSVCKQCCNDIYTDYFNEYGDLTKSLYMTCRDLDLIFNIESLEQTMSHIDGLVSKGRKADKIFGYYKSKVGSTAKKNDSITSFRFKDSDILYDDKNNHIEDKNFNQEIDDDLILFWGKGFTVDDIIFLENELANWKQTHKCDNQAEITLLKEICIKVLQIRKRRELNESTSSDVKELQDLFKTASVDPAKANIASAGKLQDSFGVWIKDIEQLKPAEWHDKQEKYKDMDGLQFYIDNYVVRPIRNFIKGNRDFQITENIDAVLGVGDSDG